MNLDRIIDMIIRQITRQVVGRGVNAGIDVATRQLSKKGEDADGKAQSPHAARQAAGAKDMAKRSRQAMRLARRMGRM